MYDVASMTVTSTNIFNNTATNSGGGFRFDAGEMTLEACDIHHNTANNGGGAHLTFLFDPLGTLSPSTSDAVVIFKSCDIHDNEATGTGGGGAWTNLAEEYILTW